MVTIGVVIPVFNRQEQALDALRSVLAQTRAADEIVVVDDASAPPLRLPASDATLPRVRVVRLTVNGGAASARQAGIDALGTTHAAFLDSDDVWLPAKLEAQARHLAAVADPDNVAVACGWRTVYADGRPDLALIPRPASTAAEFASGCWFCPGSTVVIPRRAVARAGGFDPALRRLEDLDLFIRHGLAGGCLEVTPVVGAVIRRGANARPSDVKAAATRLEARYGPAGDHPLDRDAWRNLRSWLAAERAAAQLSNGRWLDVAYWMSVSLALRPRLRVQLRNWWRPAG